MEELQAVCFNCNHFFPAKMNEPTEFGICLLNGEFEPFLDEILEDPESAACQNLIDDKKFSGDQQACDNFEEVEEILEIDEESDLGIAISKMVDQGTLNADSLQAAMMEEQVRKIDLKNLPVDQYLEDLNNSQSTKRKEALSSLGGLIVYGNTQAFEELFNYFNELPPPSTITEVHFKIDVLKQLKRLEKIGDLVPVLIQELYDTTSNNTTRQWINEIFRFLSACPKEEIKEPLEKMLTDKRFSHRQKQKIKTILAS